MNDIITQNEKRQLECNRRASELYKKLFDDFYKLVREINTAALRTRKTPIITIKLSFFSFHSVSFLLHI